MHANAAPTSALIPVVTWIGSSTRPDNARLRDPTMPHRAPALAWLRNVSGPTANTER
jgi:hypothetical protein